MANKNHIEANTEEGLMAYLRPRKADLDFDFEDPFYTRPDVSAGLAIFGGGLTYAAMGANPVLGGSLASGAYFTLNYIDRRITSDQELTEAANTSFKRIRNSILE